MILDHRTPIVICVSAYMCLQLCTIITCNVHTYNVYKWQLYKSRIKLSTYKLA